MIKEKKKRKLCIGGYPIKEYIPIVEVFSVIGAVAIAAYAVGNNVLGKCAIIYLLVYIFLIKQD